MNLFMNIDMEWFGGLDAVRASSKDIDNNNVTVSDNVELSRFEELRDGV